MTLVPAHWLDRKMKGRKILLTREGLLIFPPLFFCQSSSRDVSNGVGTGRNLRFLALAPCGWRARLMVNNCAAQTAASALRLGMRVMVDGCAAQTAASALRLGAFESFL